MVVHDEQVMQEQGLQPVDEEDVVMQEQGIPPADEDDVATGMMNRISYG